MRAFSAREPRPGGVKGLCHWEPGFNANGRTHPCRSTGPAGSGPGFSRAGRKLPGGARCPLRYAGGSRGRLPARRRSGHDGRGLRTADRPAGNSLRYAGTRGHECDVGRLRGRTSSNADDPVRGIAAAKPRASQHVSGFRSAVSVRGDGQTYRNRIGCGCSAGNDLSSLRDCARRPAGAGRRRATGRRFVGNRRHGRCVLHRGTARRTVDRDYGRDRPGDRSS